MAVIIKESFPFEFNQAECASCSARCCRGRSGNVWVNAEDMHNICKIAGVNLIDGMGRFFEKRDNRHSIREKIDSNGSSDAVEYCCVFLDGNQCSIYPVRPLQCRTFPFWDHFKTEIDQLLKECPGVKSSSELSFI